jgi:hypothetical protein
VADSSTIESANGEDGLVNQELLLKNEYLVAENRMLKAHIRGRLLLSDGEKAKLSEIAKRVGRKALAQIAHVAKPDTILAWYRNLVGQKFDGAKQRAARGRPRVEQELEDLVVKLSRSTAGWGYDRIVGALANSGPFDLRSNGREHPAAAECSARIRTREGYDVEGLHPFPHERSGGNRLLHG